MPYLPTHIESQWIVLGCSPWNVAMELTPYIDNHAFRDMWDFKQALAVRTKRTLACTHTRPAFASPGAQNTCAHLDYANMRTKHGGPTRHERTTCLQKELRGQYGVAGCIPHEHIKGVSCDRAKQRGVFVDRYGATCSIGTPRHRWPFRSGRTPHDYTASLVNAVIAVMP